MHATNWRIHYAGILPDDYLANQVFEERETYWAEALQKAAYSLVLLANFEDQPAGFIALKDNIDAGYEATIEHLHVTQSLKGKGLGRSLMREAAQQLMERGSRSVCLWVFEDNVAAIGFYESLGGVTDAHGTDKFAGGDAKDRRIGWRDLPALLTACNEGSAQ